MMKIVVLFSFTAQTQILGEHLHDGQSLNPWSFHINYTPHRMVRKFDTQWP